MKGVTVAARLVASLFSAALIALFMPGCQTYVDHCKACDWSTQFCLETQLSFDNEAGSTELDCANLPANCIGEASCDCLTANYGGPGDMCVVDQEGKGAITLVRAQTTG